MRRNSTPVSVAIPRISALQPHQWCTAGRGATARPGRAEPAVSLRSAGVGKRGAMTAKGWITSVSAVASGEEARRRVARRPERRARLVHAAGNERGARHFAMNADRATELDGDADAVQRRSTGWSLLPVSSDGRTPIVSRIRRCDAARFTEGARAPVATLRQSAVLTVSW